MIFTVFIVLSVVLRAVGQFVIVSAVLMFAVVLVVPRIAVEALYCFLGYDITVLIVGVVVLANHPAAFIAGIL